MVYAFKQVTYETCLFVCFPYAYLAFHINSPFGSKVDQILETVPGNPTDIETVQQWCPWSERPAAADPGIDCEWKN